MRWTDYVRSVSSCLFFYPGVDQLGRSPDLGSGGHRFKSCYSDLHNMRAARIFGIKLPEVRLSGLEELLTA